MSKLRCHISISLDGFVAGPNQSEENPWSSPALVDISQCPGLGGSVIWARMLVCCLP